MVKLRPLAEHRIVLNNVSWQTYECLLKDLVDSSAPRLTYDRGTLEIMSPLSEHEDANRTIALLVETVTEEWGIEVRDFGSTTFKLETDRRGFEADSCFYIQNVEQVRGASRLDLSTHPAPDLVVEVDITSISLHKRTLYAEMGIPETWRYSGTEVVILLLREGEYEEQEVSSVLPLLNRAVLGSWIERGLSGESRLLWKRELRQWAREQVQKLG